MKWEKIIVALVAAAFAVILFILLPLKSNKYSLEFAGDDAYFRLVARAYHDLDGDGESEILRYKTGNPVPAITIERANGEIVNQWNLNGEWLDRTEAYFADCDRDGFAEILTFTYFQDSIWLHVVEPLQAGGTFLHIPVDRVELYNDHQDWVINMGSPGDINGDGRDEIYFIIRAGFTLQPRKLYVLDGMRKVLMRQEASLGNNIAAPLCLDLDMDGIQEITGMVSAPGNFAGQDVQFSDTCAWLMIYDHNLQFKVGPAAYPGRPSYFHVLPLKTGKRQLLVSRHHTKSQANILNRIEVREWLGDSLQVIASRDYQSKNQIQLICVDQHREGLFVIADGQSMIWLDVFLQEKDRLDVEETFYQELYYPMDIDNDGMSEQVFFTDFSTLHILQSDFRHGIELDLGYHESYPLITAFTKDQVHYVNIYRGRQNITLSYSRNPFYPFRFLILFGFFLLYYLIFTLLLGFQKRLIESRQASEKQILHYQLTNVVQQLDPHFLFNALSNISSYYHKGEKEHAQSYLARVSRLVRATLENSERMTISLGEEITFVRDYLSVEQIRMGDRLDFSIEIDRDLQEQIQIPKMLIQNFVENAVKHGIRHIKERKGMIRILSRLVPGHLHIIIEDNGIGRQKASELGSGGTGKGLTMVKKTLDIFEKLEKVHIGFRIEDLRDEAHHPSGTRVYLKIPLPGHQ